MVIHKYNIYEYLKFLVSSDYFATPVYNIKVVKFLNYGEFVTFTFYYDTDMEFDKEYRMVKYTDVIKLSIIEYRRIDRGIKIKSLLDGV